MGRNGFIFMLITVSFISAASTSRSGVGFRKLAAEESTNASPEIQASSGSSLPASKPLDNTSDDQSKKSKGLDSPKISDEKNPDVSATVNSPDAQKVSKKGANKKKEVGMNKQTEIGEPCSGKPNKCSDKGALSSCILTSVTFSAAPTDNSGVYGLYDGAGDKEVEILIQNKGDTDLKIKLDFPSKAANGNKGLEVLKHQTKKINVSVVLGKDIKLVLNAGHGDCTLLLAHLVQPGKMAFVYFPSFDKLLTPINGVYLSVLTVSILAGIVACWKCRKTRHGEARYQQLEMGSQGEEAPGAMNSRPVDGWDEGWDDDWDEENAVKSPAGRPAGSISAHGLTSRMPNKDGWENDWDD